MIPCHTEYMSRRGRNQFHVFSFMVLKDVGNRLIMSMTLPDQSNEIHKHGGEIKIKKAIKKYSKMDKGQILQH